MKRTEQVFGFALKLLPLAAFFIVAAAVMGGNLQRVSQTVGAHLQTGAGTAVVALAQPGALQAEAERGVRSAFRLYDPAKEALATLDSALGKRERRNFAYIKDTAGFLHAGNFYNLPYTDTMAYAKQIAALQKAAGLPLLFVAGTDRDSATAPFIPRGYPVNRYAKIHMEELLLGLYMNGVETLDLSWSALARLPPQELYFRTSTAIRAKASLQVLATVAVALAEKCGCVIENIDYYADPAQYHERVYPGRAGELSQSTGIAFGGTEDVAVLYPAFATAFTVTPPQGGRARTGAFVQTLLNLEEIADENPLENNLQGVWLSQEKGLWRITNNLLPGGAKVLLVCDSYFLPFATYLSTACAQVGVVTPLAYTGTVDIASLSEGYDCIVVAFAPQSISPQAFVYSATAYSARYNQMEEQSDGEN